MKEASYALHIGEVDPRIVNDYADNSRWFDTLEEAMTAAREAISEGAAEEDVEVQKFYDSGDVAWDFPITFDGGAWSESEDALEEMGAIVGKF